MKKFLGKLLAEALLEGVRAIGRRFGEVIFERVFIEVEEEEEEKTPVEEHDEPTV